MTAVQGVASEEGADRKMPPGVVVEGPLVDAKFRDSYIAFGFMIAGTIAALVWAFTQGIGWVEISVFAGMFALSTVGIGFMHRYFVHRSFRCGPVMRTLFAAIATMAVQGSVLKWVSNHRRHHLHSDKPGDVHSPYYDGAGQRHVSFVKGMLHAQGGWVWDKATTDGEYYAKDILADPIAMFFTRTRWYWYAISAVLIPGAIGYALGGVHAMIGCVLFSGLFRSYVMTMATSLVNSVCHSDGRYGYRRPAGGFFLWLDVGNCGGGSDAAVTLWQRAAVKVLPGAFLAQAGHDGINPGTNYVRLALVHDVATIRAALERFVVVLA